MSEYWQVHPYTVIGFLAFGLIVALSNHHFIPRLGCARPRNGLPFVTILIPARDEAANIEACVISLLDQEYPDFEVLVLDDQSTDETRLILDRISGPAGKRLRIFEGSAPPPGWIGKHWACHQLAKNAGEGLLLFTDADTRHRPNMLRDSVSMLIETNADLLTVFPREQVVTFGEKLTVPILSFAIFSFVPLFLSRWLRLPALSITIGQFMLIRPSVYAAVGGYEAVRSYPVDDVSFGRRVIRQGYKWLLADGTDHVVCRMYAGYREAVDGFTKNLFPFFDHHILLYLTAWTWMAIAFLEPLLVLLLRPFDHHIGFFPPSLAWIAVSEAVLLFAVAFHRFRFPMPLILLYPMSLAVFVYIAFRSLLHTLTGHRNWKSRRLPPPILKW